MSQLARNNCNASRAFVERLLIPLFFKDTFNKQVHIRTLFRIHVIGPIHFRLKVSAISVLNRQISNTREVIMHVFSCMTLLTM